MVNKHHWIINERFIQFYIYALFINHASDNKTMNIDCCLKSIINTLIAKIHKWQKEEIKNIWTVYNIIFQTKKFEKIVLFFFL